MAEELLKQIECMGILPVIKLNDAKDAVPLAKALCEGGLPCAEVTFRTDAAKESIAAMTKAYPKMLVGAGTVLNAEQVDAAVEAGAKFIVSPGLNPDTVEYCVKKGIPILPGCSSPSDIEQAIKYGLNVVKFFPAEAAGGLKAIKAMAAPYGQIRFMPTGGINPSNVSDYLAEDKILACGGTWMVPAAEIEAGNFDKIRELTEEGIQVKEHPLLASALLISGYDYLAAIPAFREGKFQVQDAASIMVAEQAGIKEGDYILDVCAAPGGKALHAAQILNGTGMVEARDLTEMKVELIRENISRMGFENIRAVQQDATCFDADSEEKADVLIADLPCSGLGVLAKKTDLKYKMNPETETEVAALQREILDTVCRYVKPEGTLMYSTCTISRTENEENAGWFAEKHPEFDLEWEKQIFPSDITDGFYIAKFIRRGR